MNLKTFFKYFKIFGLDKIFLFFIFLLNILGIVLATLSVTFIFSKNVPPNPSQKDHENLNCRKFNVFLVFQQFEKFFFDKFWYNMSGTGDKA